MCDLFESFWEYDRSWFPTQNIPTKKGSKFDKDIKLRKLLFCIKMKKFELFPTKLIFYNFYIKLLSKILHGNREILRESVSANVKDFWREPTVSLTEGTSFRDTINLLIEAIQT